MTTNYLPYDLLRNQFWTNWTGNAAFTGLTGDGPTGVTLTTDGSTSGDSRRAGILTAVTKGIDYRVSFDLTINSGSPTITADIVFDDDLSTASGSPVVDGDYTITSSGSYSSVFPGKDSVQGDIYFAFSVADSLACSFTVTNLRIETVHKISPQSFVLRRNTQASKTVSPFTGQEQVYAHRGQFWELELTMPPMPVEYARLWSVWFANQNGMENDFYFRPINMEKATGAASTMPGDVAFIDGNVSAQATTFTIDGLDASTADWFIPGDFIECNGQLFEITGGAMDSNPSGEITPTVWPYVREAISDNTRVEHTHARGKFRLVHTDFSWTQTQKGIVDSFTIRARESF